MGADDRNGLNLVDLVDTASIGLHCVAQDGTILWANPADYESLGYIASEYIGRNIAEFHADPDVVGDMLRRLSSGERLHNCEARLRCKGGSTRRVLISSSARFDEHGRFLHTRCFTVDISNRRADSSPEVQIETLSREVERLSALATRDRGLLDAILYHSPHGIIVCDAQGKLTLQNRAAERIWAGSASAENVREWASYRAFHPDGRPYDPGDWSMARCLSKRETTEAEEIHIQRFDDSFGWLLGSSTPILSRSGEVEGALSVFADITQLKGIEDTNVRLYEAEREARAKAEAESRMREDLVAVVSHDLKNPLSSISTATALLQSMGGSGEAPERAQKYIGTIARAAGTMNRLIGDLLDLASMESGTFQVSCTANEMAPILRECVEILVPVATSKGLRFECNVEGYGIWVYCDAPRVSQVLSNLIGNAIKFTPNGGTIRVDVETSGEETRISVSDTGPGIPEENLEHIFDRYWRPRQERAVGTGLGLAIAKGLVVAQGGRIWVESRVGKGTAFFFTLRSAQPAAAPTSEPPVPSDGESRKRRLLVVDDDKELRESLCEFLEESGYDVVGAEDGAAALEQLKSAEKPDLILLDLLMPGMNGWQFCELQRQDPELASIPLLVMSANRDLKGLPSGPNAVVHKPLRLEQLLKAIARQCATAPA